MGGDRHLHPSAGQRSGRHAALEPESRQRALGRRDRGVAGPGGYDGGGLARDRLRRPDRGVRRPSRRAPVRHPSRAHHRGGATLPSPLRSFASRWAQASTIISKPPKMSRLPSKGIGLTSGLRRGSVMTFCIPSSRARRDGQSIQENTTVSSFLHFTAMGNEVTSPSGTSSPQHSTTLSAPYSLNTAAAFSAWTRYFSRLAVGTAATNPST